MIAQGSYARVSEQNGLAVKTWTESMCREDALYKLRERYLLRHLKHPNVIQVFASDCHSMQLELHEQDLTKFKPTSEGEIKSIVH